MDHLPRPPNPAFAQDDVPYTAVENYSYNDFDLKQFPLPHRYVWQEGIGKYARQNYNLLHEDVNRTSDSGIDRPKQTSFIQAWFGPLINVFSLLDIPFERSDFLYERSGQKFLTLQPLEGYVPKWSDANDQARDTHRAAVDEVLELVEVLAQENLYRRQRYRKLWFLSPIQSLSIQLLHEALRYTWNSIYMPGSLYVATGAGLMSDLPEQRMKAALWCPSDIAMAQHRFSVTGRYFACRLKWLRKALDHERCTHAK